MKEAIINSIFWIITSPHFLWRVPLVVIGALLSWAIWWWLWDVFKPWMNLSLRILGRVFDRIGDLLDFIPKWSNRAALYVEHTLRVCSCVDGYKCKYESKTL